MGLDMFLIKKKEEEVGYWRKANAIHAWFDRKYGGIENCQEYLVSKDDLIELRSTCKQVLNACKVNDGLVVTGQRMTDKGWENNYTEGKIIENPEVAEELLPSQSGFFFGSTDYDEFYLDDLTNTVEQIDQILETTDFDKEKIYYHAWW